MVGRYIFVTYGACNDAEPRRCTGRINPAYRRRFSKTASARYYMNHCACGAQLGDFYMHSEPDGAFFPTTRNAARAIRLRELRLRGPITITGSHSMVRPNLIREYAERVGS